MCGKRAVFRGADLTRDLAMTESGGNDWVLSCDRLGAEQGEQAGGKGATLARLRQRGYPVPSGFIVLPSAFTGDELKAEAWARVKEELARLRWGDDGAGFAVRSSALAEDSASASFAGQYRRPALSQPEHLCHGLSRHGQEHRGAPRDAGADLVHAASARNGDPASAASGRIRRALSPAMDTNRAPAATGGQGSGQVRSHQSRLVPAGTRVHPRDAERTRAADTLLTGSVSEAADLPANLGPLVGIDKVARGKMDREVYLDRYGHRGPHEFELS